MYPLFKMYLFLFKMYLFVLVLWLAFRCLDSILKCLLPPQLVPHIVAAKLYLCAETLGSKPIGNTFNFSIVLAFKVLNFVHNGKVSVLFPFLGVVLVCPAQSAYRAALRL